MNKNNNIIYCTSNDVGINKYNLIVIKVYILFSYPYIILELVKYFRGL